ncbi:MAG: hypothetical protein ACJ8R9_31105 [Steroidobacteraceae bacterium]
MTSERAARPLMPFSLRFSRRIPLQPPPPLRYDETRQLSQVLVDGAWVDCVEARSVAESMSRETRVRGETRDDE